MRWLDPYVLYHSDINTFTTILMETFGADEEGKLITSSHNHSIHIYQKVEPTGATLYDDQGHEYPETRTIPGYFADVRVRTPEPRLNTLAIEPNRSVAKHYEALSQQTRLDVEFGLLPFGNVLIQTGLGKDGIRGIDRLTGVMSEVAIHPEKETEIINWIAADNSIVKLSYQDVTKIVSAFNMRQQALFNQYAQWRSGDRQEPFDPNVDIG